MKFVNLYVAICDLKEGLKGETERPAKMAKHIEVADFTPPATEVDSSDTELASDVPDTLA